MVADELGELVAGLDGRANFTSLQAVLDVDGGESRLVEALRMKNSRAFGVVFRFFNVAMCLGPGLAHLMFKVFHGSVDLVNFADQFTIQFPLVFVVR